MSKYIEIEEVHVDCIYEGELFGEFKTRRRWLNPEMVKTFFIDTMVTNVIDKDDPEYEDGKTGNKEKEVLKELVIVELHDNDHIFLDVKNVEWFIEALALGD
jgi:hypothetical protein